MKTFDFTTNNIKKNLNSNTTDYVNMFTSLFLVIAFSILIAYVKDKPNANIYIPLILVAIALFLLHALYKMSLLIKRKMKINKLLDNDEVVDVRWKP